MKGILIVSNFWTKLFSGGKAEAITLFPFIFVRSRVSKNDAYLLNHERIHLLQALEMLVIPFYLWYIIEFFVRYVKFKDFEQAYLNISFEREAYSNQFDVNYLSKRKLWCFFKYL